jgi:hypothetical protein
VVTYFEISQSPLYSERWRTRHEPRIFLDERCTNRVVIHFSEISVDFMSQTVEIGTGVLRFFSDDIPVTEYLPVVFDAFVDQTKWVLRADSFLPLGCSALRLDRECVLSSGANLFMLEIIT